MNRGAWRATVYGVTKSRTRLNDSATKRQRRSCREGLTVTNVLMSTSSGNRMSLKMETMALGLLFIANKQLPTFCEILKDDKSVGRAVVLLF